MRIKGLATVSAWHFTDNRQVCQSTLFASVPEGNQG